MSASGEDPEVSAAQSRPAPSPGHQAGGPTKLGPRQDASTSGDELPGGTAARSPVGREGGRRGRRGATQELIDPDRPRTYYGTAVLKPPVWEGDIAVYFFTGGLAGASASLAAAAELAGNERLARSAWVSALAGVGISPVLLIKDLGRPGRFLNMLRVFKITSPMSVGTWILTASAGGISLAAARSLLGWFPRAGVGGAGVAGALGPALTTYTAVLIADTAVPAWHEAYRELPFTFAGSAAGSAGAAAVLLTPIDAAGPARRLTALGAALEIATSRLTQRRLGEVGRPYREGEGGRFLKLAEGLTAAGAALVAVGGGHRRALAAAGGALVLGGAMATRWGIYKAGFPSSEDPDYVVGPQRERLNAREGRQSAAPA